VYYSDFHLLHCYYSYRSTIFSYIVSDANENFNMSRYTYFLKNHFWKSIGKALINSKNQEQFTCLYIIILNHGVVKVRFFKPDKI